MTFVLDCSVTMAWCFDDEADRYTNAVLESLANEDVIAPAIWPLEVSNVLLVAERRRRLDRADTERFLDLVGSLPIAVEELGFRRATGDVLGRAREFGLSAYDGAYLELAMRAGLSLATRDRGLRAASRKAGVPLFDPR